MVAPGILGNYLPSWEVAQVPFQTWSSCSLYGCQKATTEDTDIDGKRKGYRESVASTYKPRKLEQKDHHKPKASLGCREIRKHKVGRRVRKHTGPWWLD